MARQITIVLVAFLLIASLAQGARVPSLRDDKTNLKKFEKVGDAKLYACEGIGEDECLTRRTLVAHTDYIYTQDNHN
ncbi:phytosulfokines-like protein [Carex littledalei]|uniref:Phytosulfokine n=1 Tax=Carex littledalei TaxID=544730 RepID=A0A833VN21_9POAL|nr:Phytosulfokines 3 [Carex littledalei]KAF3333765.1 phytosulfokines-like protein [Carex littledalei]